MCMHVWLCVYAFMGVCVCVDGCVYVCMYVCMDVCVCVYVRTRICSWFDVFYPGRPVWKSRVKGGRERGGEVCECVRKGKE